MTLEATSRRILDAAEAQDLDALEQAYKDRASALAELSSIAPTRELRDAIVASIGAGECATQAIRAIQQRLRQQSRRLAHIDHGFLAVQRATAKHQIDFKG